MVLDDTRTPVEPHLRRDASDILPAVPSVASLVRGTPATVYGGMVHWMRSMHREKTTEGSPGMPMSCRMGSLCACMVVAPRKPRRTSYGPARACLNAATCTSEGSLASVVRIQ